MPNCSTENPELRKYTYFSNPYIRLMKLTVLDKKVTNSPPKMELVKTFSDHKVTLEIINQKRKNVEPSKYM